MLTVAGISIEVRPLTVKANASMVVTLEGMVIEVSAKVYAKAYSEMTVTPTGIVTEVSKVAPENA